ncbi:MAG: cation diffusion facilitator family transporter [Candidatus Ranarchaeia archaeon]
MEDSNYKEVKKILTYILVLNVIVTVAKISIGILSNTVSILADGLHSSIDTLNNVIGIIVIKVASKPEDEDHPFGHKKFEIIGALFISFLLFVTCLEVIESVIERFFMGTPDYNITSLTYYIMIFTVIVNIFVTLYEKRCARRLQSNLLESDASHTKVDVFVSISILIGIYLIQLGFYMIDFLLAIVIVLIIAQEGIKLFKVNVMILTDTVAVEVEQIEEIVKSLKGVEGVHRIRSRGFPGDIWISFHMTLDPNLSLDKAHKISDDVEKKIMEKIKGVREVIIHIEPEEN